MNQSKPMVSGLERLDSLEYPVIMISGYFEEKLANELATMVEGLLLEGKTDLVIDLGNCVAINSLAIGTLQSLTMKIEDFRGTLVLSKISTAMERVFELAFITPFAQVAPDVTGAISLLKELLATSNP